MPPTHAGDLLTQVPRLLPANLKALMTQERTDVLALSNSVDGKEKAKITTVWRTGFSRLSIGEADRRFRSLAMVTRQADRTAPCPAHLLIWWMVGRQGWFRLYIWCACRRFRHASLWLGFATRTVVFYGNARNGRAICYTGLAKFGGRERQGPNRARPLGRRNRPMGQRCRPSKYGGV